MINGPCGVVLAQFHDFDDTHMKSRESRRARIGINNKLTADNELLEQVLGHTKKIRRTDPDGE
jgi:hypothetical protein